jgi:uncharacterized protein involved in exopolysaccharide biosynthesis
MHDPKLAAAIANGVAQSYADERLALVRAWFPNAELKGLVRVLDPARPAPKPSLSLTADFTLPALGAALSAVMAGIFAAGILSLTKRCLSQGRGASI